MYQVLQVLEIFKVWICHIFEFFWPTKRPELSATNQRSVTVMVTIYVKNIGNLYLIVYDIRRRDRY